MITVKTIVNPEFANCVPMPCKRGNAFYIEQNKKNIPEIYKSGRGSVLAEDPNKEFEDDIEFSFRAYSGFYD